MCMRCTSGVSVVQKSLGGALHKISTKDFGGLISYVKYQDRLDRRYILRSVGL